MNKPDYHNVDPVKPGYNSSIEDKIRWLEWFQSIRERIQSNTGKREIDDFETLSKYCNINVLKTNNSSLERVKTRNTKISHLSTDWTAFMYT